MTKSHYSAYMLYYLICNSITKFLEHKWLTKNINKLNHGIQIVKSESIYVWLLFHFMSL
jgi:hypothetical protein